MKNILICTLGASWAVVPEIYGYLSPDKLPLYNNHLEFKLLNQRYNEYRLQSVDEIWICTTQGTVTENSLIKLSQWIQLLAIPPILRIWQAQETSELANHQECEHIQELILRCCLKAHEEVQGGQLVMSLAGGRKTMSADMQWAASLFGCQALLHVVGAEYKQMPELLQQANPDLFTQPFNARICKAIMPIITGQTARSDILDIRMDNIAAITTETFPLPLPENGKNVAWLMPKQSLAQELKKREKISSRLLGNYFFDLSREEKHENWRSLYRLSPRIIEQLRTTSLTEQHKKWLDSLPKADLHRHLGGCLSLQQQRKVGEAIWTNLETKRKQNALASVKHLLSNQNTWDWDWAKQLKQQPNRADLSAALLVTASDQQLNHNLWHVTEPRIALKARHPHGFSAYERPGELTGSTLLAAPEAWQTYAQGIVAQSISEGLSYIELRGSPQKYGDGLVFIKHFYQYLQQTLASLPEENRPLFRFIIIADRRIPEDLKKTIQMAVKAKAEWPDFIVGLDMAGDESYPISETISQCFLPAFEQCIPITIHAGEGEKPESIWKAAYHLHADRIGHGLTIADHPKLAERFRNRDICLELCPTSNREVVGFYDNRNQMTNNLPEYPFKALWEQGLPLTICTDNPGISRTTLSEEFITAAAMDKGTLSLWDTLAIIKQGFVHSFLSGREKEELIKQCDARIYQQLVSNKWQ